MAATTKRQDKALVDQANYAKALRSGNLALCTSIEMFYEVYGLPPEMVSEALANAVVGREGEQA